jgi:hypothetical protein
MEGRFTFGSTMAHDFRSVVSDYLVWGVQTGVQNFYSTRFDFIDGLVVGDIDAPIRFVAAGDNQSNNSEGIGVSHNHNDANSIAFRGLRIEGFEYGFQVFSPFNDLTREMSPYAFSELERASIANVQHAFLSTSGHNGMLNTQVFRPVRNRRGIDVQYAWLGIQSCADRRIRIHGRGGLLCHARCFRFL